MKFWVKIVVALSVVVVIAFGIWAFVFKEKDEVVAYNKVCEIVDYKESLGTKEKLISLRKYNYYGEDASQVFSSASSNEKSIISLRETMLSDTIITTYDEGGNVTCYFDSYIVMEQEADNIISSLLPYIKNTTGIDSLTKELKSIAKKYTSSYKSLSDNIDNLNSCQATVTGTNTEMEVLLGNYSNLRVTYRECLNNASQLIAKMFEIIKAKYSQTLFDTKLALMDGFGRSLNVATKSSIKIMEEPYYAHDLHLVLDKIIKINQNVNIFSTKYTEYGFLNSYNTLSNKYSSEYNKALGKQNIAKQQMADGQNLSEIVIGAQSSLIYVLNVLGY